MKQILPLIRIQLLEFLPVKALRNTNDDAARKRARKRLTSTLVTFLACVYMAVAYSMPMLSTLNETNFTVVPALMLAMAAVLGAITTLTKAGQVMFSASSIDQLLTLPLSRPTVILSRIFSLYYEELLINAGVVLSAGVCCQIRMGAYLSPAFWPVLILTVFLAPLIPLGVGGLAGLFVAMLTARMKRKNIFTIIFSLLFLAGVMVFSFNTGTLFANMSAVADAMSAKIFSIYPPARLFVSALGGDWTAFLLFAAIAVALLGLLCFAAVKGFTFFYVAINATAEAKAFRMGRQKQTGKLLTLCKKELKQKLNTPIWIMNTDMGTLMAILLSILLVVTGREPIMEVLAAMSPLDKAPGVLFGLVIAAVQCMSLSATASVSMEGRSLWLIKSLPIRANTWLRSKLLVSMLPPVLGGFVCSLLLTIAWRLPVWNVPVMLGLSVLFAWAFSVVELALGLKFARFDWENPAEVVKQSAGVLLGMLVTFLVVGAGIALVLFLGPLGAAAMCVLLLVIALPIRLVMGKRSEKMLTNL